MKELSLNILDIVENSVRAGADAIKIIINESVASDTYQIIISDNGKGIPGELLDHVTDPFYTTRTTRKIGLGLPLLKYHAELTGGSLKISNNEPKGTIVTADFSFSHIDRQPLGDISGTLMILGAMNDKIDFRYLHNTDKGSYSFSTAEAREVLEVESLNSGSLIADLSSMIYENLIEIGASGVEMCKSYNGFK